MKEPTNIEAATHSEDGREVPEIVAEVSTMGFGKNCAMGIGDPIDKCKAGDKLMAVAQHSRIVAAKDAEIARLEKECTALAASACDGVVGDDYGHSFCRYKKELEQLRAQPARQVGGDKLQAKVTEFIERARRTAKLHREVADGLEEHDADEAAACDHMADINTEAADLLEELAHAALATAAVVTDADIETTAQLIYTQWDAVEGYVPWVKGGNSHQQDYARKLARELFARLNRRAIPLELLERVKGTLEYWISRTDTRGMSESDYKSWLALGHQSKAMTELRALLEDMK